MDLTIADVSRLLDMPPSAVRRHIRRKEIPAYRIDHCYRFHRAEIIEWALNNNVPINAALARIAGGALPIDIAELARRGGVFRSVPGDTPREVINNAVALLSLPADIDRDMIASQLIAREEMRPTAVGNGIALPHPKSPMMTDTASERIAFFMLAAPVDFRAADGAPVNTICIMLSANQNRHLEMLSKIAHLCRDNTFVGLLKRAPLPETIISYIETVSKQWKAV